MPDYKVIHKQDSRCFSISIDDAEAVLEYALPNVPTVDAKVTIDFKRTYVPQALRGKGIAKILVDEGLAWARQQGYTITASCSYVQQVIA